MNLVSRIFGGIGPDSSLEAVGVRGIYLGNYVRWDPLAQHRLMSKIAGYGSAKMQRTFDIYDHVDDWHYMGLHDLIKYQKHGLSKVVDQACREIRHGRLTREQASQIVMIKSKENAQHTNLFCQWLGIETKELEFMIEWHQRHQPNYINNLTEEQVFSSTPITEQSTYTLEMDPGPASDHRQRLS